MQAVSEKSGLESALSVLPSRVASEIERRAALRVGGRRSIREIRLSALGASSVLFGTERVGLSGRVSESEVLFTLTAICEGALYASRDRIAEGYLSLPHGVRVGISGRARYDGERLVGVSDVTSLVFRLPTGECAFADELYEIYRAGIGRGALIYSPPGVGKTTALRSLAVRASVGKGARRVAIIDERCELSAASFEGCEALLLSGYKKAYGMEIATRTLSPELIFVDELSASDAEGVMSVLRSGVPLVATAHAASLEDLRMRQGIAELVAAGAFSVFVGIFRSDSGYFLKVDRV